MPWSKRINREYKTQDAITDNQMLVAKIIANNTQERGGLNTAENPIGRSTLGTTTQFLPHFIPNFKCSVHIQQMCRGYAG